MLYHDSVIWLHHRHMRGVGVVDIKILMWDLSHHAPFNHIITLFHNVLFGKYSYLFYSTPPIFSHSNFCPSIVLYFQKLTTRAKQFDMRTFQFLPSGLGTRYRSRHCVNMSLKIRFIATLYHFFLIFKYLLHKF